MDWILLCEQLLNGLQLGTQLFLLTAGLTLVFGIMDFVNLAHGSFYMLGAFLAATVALATESLLIGVAVAVPAVFIIGVLVELGIVRALYRRNHLDHVLATFGLILFANAAVEMIWPPDGLNVPLPEYLAGAVRIPPGIDYPVYRLLNIVFGLAMAVLLWFLVTRTRAGMLVRAGSSNRTMAQALGVDIPLLFTALFAAGAVLAGLAGMFVMPVLGAASGMGEQIIIQAFVVIVIGGIGSVHGAFVAAVFVGLIDTLGRSFLDVALLRVLSENAAEAAGPALSSMLIYLFMVVVLFFRPRGLFPPKGAA